MSVELLRSYGTDLDIVNAARVSFHKQSEWQHVGDCARCGRVLDWGHGEQCPEHPRASSGNIRDELSTADRGLIGFLMKNQHATPFEMVDLTFRVRCPIGVAREWMRHRVFSFNEESTRYVEMRPDFYVPEPEAVRTQVGKPGAYTMEPVAADMAEFVGNYMKGACETAYAMYQHLLGCGVAKELARNVLPLGLLTEFIVKGNLRGWLHFIHLRTAPNALLEIRQEAEQVEQHIATIVPVAYRAWVDCGRQSL